MSKFTRGAVAVLSLTVAGSLAVPAIAADTDVNLTKLRAVTKPEKDKVVIKGKVSSPKQKCIEGRIGIGQKNGTTYLTTKARDDGRFRKAFDHKAGKTLDYTVYVPNRPVDGCKQVVKPFDVKNVDGRGGGIVGGGG